jgi:hypothetical protein
MPSSEICEVQEGLVNIYQNLPCLHQLKDLQSKLLPQHFASDLITTPCDSLYSLVAELAVVSHDSPCLPDFDIVSSR